MNFLDNLQVDTMTIDTKLAKNYFEEHNYTFYCVVQHETKFVPISDGYNSFVINGNSLVDFDKSLPQYMDIKDNFKLSKLSKDIENNADLFGQIDYIIRHVPVEQVKKYDMSLLSRNLLYCSLNPYISNIPGKLLIHDDTPLASLGFVSQMLEKYGKALIITTAKTAAACCLFVELCRGVGLTNVYLTFVNKITDCSAADILDISSMKGINSGCLGVITENADLESALAVLLETPSQKPWKLSEILVQESVYELFKKAMEWRCGDLKSTSVANIRSDFYTFKDKVFVMDMLLCAGIDNKQEILVNAYRTTKELLSLVASKNLSFMSLWSNDINEANEICHNEKSPNIIWVNKYGGFDGPAISSQALYRNLLISNTVRKSETDKVQTLLEKRQLWLKNSIDERVHILRSIILEQSDKDPYKYWMERLCDLSKDDLIRTNSSETCICKRVALPVTFLNSELYDYKDFDTIGFTVIEGLVKGTAFVIDSGSNSTIFNDLANQGAPVIMYEQPKANVECSDIIDLVKVIYIS
ncbi:hypothetical protein ACJJTC_010335 [Scirpophaga incertulas]